MVLETILNTGKINIKDLILDEPLGTTPIFDPERDVTESDWQHIKAMFEDVRERRRSYHHSADFASFGTSMKILFPKKADELNLEDRHFIILSDFIMRLREGNDSYTYSLNCMRLKILFPQKVPELNVTDDDWDWWEKSYREQTTIYSNWGDVLTRATAMYIFNPNKIIQMGILNESLYEDLKRQIPKDDEHQLANLKILFPNKKIELEVNYWKQLNSLLKVLRDHEESWHFADQAADMKILAAEEVRVTNQGLDIIMSKSKEAYQQLTPSLPEIRRF